MQEFIIATSDPLLDVVRFTNVLTYFLTYFRYQPSNHAARIRDYKLDKVHIILDSLSLANS